VARTGGSALILRSDDTIEALMGGVAAAWGERERS